MKKYILEKIEKNINAIKKNLSDETINNRTKLINNEYFLGKNTAFLEILKEIDLEEFEKQHEKNKETTTKALLFTSKIYSL